ncbi:hypothetical protein RND71_040674 [Anisodus tanguticus]|uniref:Leucine-rich repeat-containing N-terminal plant-type domain-containing protein n=1 Tax=Anisodus tanguticus TaxID=243964 RepID=A0AAE1QW26_9SOLA|nr:hypothetical protein RND71_040674 [Anisodus tanguticus]
MKVLAITLWVILFLILKNTKFVVCVGICRENEQRALESLNKEVDDPTNSLASWVVGKDCCEWEGVVCNNLTRHVIELHIVNHWQKSGYLIRINSLEWLPSLLSLEHLDMHYVDLSKATNWLQVINMLPSLVDLSLSHCSLHHIQPLLHHNFSSLETLHLSGNKFNSPVPKWIFNLANLVSLNLSDNNFTGPFPEGPVNFTSLTTFKASFNSFNYLSNLEYLDLSYNMLSGKLPNVIGKLGNLEYLDLSGNLFEGEVSEIFNGNFVSAEMGNSSSLNAKTLPESLGQLSMLKTFIIYNNRLTGTLPESLGQLSMLEYFAISYNRFTGTLPESLGQLSMLKYFAISDNRLEGVVTESHFSKLTQLKSFYASKNNLTLKVSENWIPPFQAETIKIRGWNIGPLFPVWFRTQKLITDVDISDGGIQGEVPTWFWNLTSQIRILNLSHNQFVGEVPNISPPSIEYGDPWLMYLGSNNFSGPLPQISTNVSLLDLSKNSFSKGLSNLLCEAKNKSYKLEILNLEGNDLSEEIPDCWMNWPELRVLILRDNNLIGGIPKSMEVLSNLQSLDLGRNRLNGPFPLKG